MYKVNGELFFCDITDSSRVLDGMSLASFCQNKAEHLINAAFNIFLCLIQKREGGKGRIAPPKFASAPYCTQTIFLIDGVHFLPPPPF